MGLSNCPLTNAFHDSTLSPPILLGNVPHPVHREPSHPADEGLQSSGTSVMECRLGALDWSLAPAFSSVSRGDNERLCAKNLVLRPFRRPGPSHVETPVIPEIPLLPERRTASVPALTPPPSIRDNVSYCPEMPPFAPYFPMRDAPERPRPSQHLKSAWQASFMRGPPARRNVPYSGLAPRIRPHYPPV